MTKKLKVYLLIILSAICAACAFAGCKVGRAGREEVLKGYNTSVTYYANGGFFDGSTTMRVREVYFKLNPETPEGIPFFDVTGDTQGLQVARDGYDLVGWFVPEVYEDGEHAGEIKYTYTYRADNGEEVTIPVYPVLNEDGTPVTDNEAERPLFYNEQLLGDTRISEKDVILIESDTIITSENIIAQNDSLIVCAKWIPSLKIVYRLVCEEGKTYTDANGKSYKNGDELRSDNFGKGDVATPTSLEPVTLNGASFVKSYLDENLTTLAGPIDRPEDNVNPVVYSRYIDGEGWTIVDEASKVTAMFNSLLLSGKYFILNDIDCSGQNISLKSGNALTAVTNATIAGNGHTISNITFSPVNAMSGENTYSTFGVAGENFSVSGLTLENVTISYTTSGNTTFYALFAGAEDGAEFTDFTVDGISARVKLPIDKGNYMYNAQNDDRSNWLFGGVASDEEFLAEHTGITITGETTLTLTV